MTIKIEKMTKKVNLMKREEEIEQLTKEEEIKLEYIRWVRQKYDEDKCVTSTNKGKKIVIETDEIIKAIKELNKNKALGMDNLSLKPLD